MNHVYRIVFNRSIGAWQVASELTRTAGGHSSSSKRTVKASGFQWAFRWMLGIAGLVAVLDVLPVHAQTEPGILTDILSVQGPQGRIVADPNAPGDQRPTVLTAPNGVPLVNITTPSEAGVSRNTYSQLDVGSEGLIFNNSRGNVQTQLGGWVQGNPWLVISPARVILNEVNGPVSQLNGYIEIAGTRAELVIANPSGIQVNGGGFINASRATLTTGTPIFAGGALDHYRVEGGAISINGAGLDASRADYTDLISRSLEVNAGIWAQQLRVSLGRNVVNADHSQTTEIAGGDQAPRLALDVAALGGMYANKITLIGTEDGLGARNAGAIGARAGEVVVSIDGLLANTGALQAQSDTSIEAAGGLINAGTISAVEELSIATSAAIDNSGGTLNAQRLDIDAAGLNNRAGSIEQTGSQELVLSAASLSNQGGRIGVAAPAAPGAESGGSAVGDPGSNSSGADAGSADPDSAGGTSAPTAPSAPFADGEISISGLLNNDSGGINAGGDIELSSADGLDNRDGRMNLDQLSLGRGDLDNRAGELWVADSASISASQILNNDGEISIGGPLVFEAQNFSNRGGSLIHGGAASTALAIDQSFDNTGGLVGSMASALTIDSATLVNERGQIVHAGDQGLRISTQSLDGAEGSIGSAGAVELFAGHVDYQGASLSGTRITVAADDFDNRGGGLFATGADISVLNVRGTLNNDAGGTIASNGDLDISALRFANAGGFVQHAGNGTLIIQANTLDGSGGGIASNGSLTLVGEAIDLSSGSTQARDIVVETGSLDTAGGHLSASGTGPLVLDVRGAINNADGDIGANGALDLQAQSLNNQGGQIGAAGAAASRIAVLDAIDNRGGSIAGAGDITLSSGLLFNQGGTLIVTGQSRLSVDTDGQIDNSAGILATGGDLSLQSDALDNSRGLIQLSGAGTLSIATGTLTGTAGTLASQGELYLRAGQTDLSGGLTQAYSVDIAVGTLSTAGGVLTALGPDTLRISVAGHLNNGGGNISSNGAMDLQALSVNNYAGSIASNGDLQLDTTALDNTLGLIRQSGIGSLQLSTGSFQGAGGTLSSSGSLSLSGDTIDLNGSATIGGSVYIDADVLTTVDATLISTGAGPMVLHASTAFDNRGGTITSNGGLDLQTAFLDNREGRINAAGNALSRFNVINLFDNRGGVVATAGDATVTAGDLLNHNGVLLASGPSALSVNVNGRLDNSAQGIIAAGGDIQLSAATLDNRTGVIQHAGDGALTISVDNLLGQLGTIVSNGFVKLIGEVVDLSQANTQAEQISVDAGTLNNSGGTLLASGAEALLITVREWLDNSAGVIAGNGALEIAAEMLDNLGGILSAAGRDLSRIVVGDQFDNRDGQLISAGDSEVRAGELLNQDGLVVAAGDSTLLVRIESMLENSLGVIAAGGDMDLSAAVLRNLEGIVQHAGDGLLNIVADSLQGRAGSITSNGALNLSGGAIDLSSASTQAEQISIDVGALNNAGGTLLASGDELLQLRVLGDLSNNGGVIAGNGALGVQAQALSNQGGTIQSASSAPSSIQVDGQFDNNGGRLLTAGDAVVSAAELRNRGGVIQTADQSDLTVDISGRLDNGSAGTLAAGGDLALSASILDNRSGAIQHAGDGSAVISAGQLRGAGGSIISNAELILSGNATDLSGATTQAQQISISTGSLSTAGGTLVAAGDEILGLSVSGDFNNRDGTIAGNGGLDLYAGSLSNVGGSIQTAGAQGSHIEVTQRLDNSGGTLAAAGVSTISAGELLNRDGSIQASAAEGLFVEVRDRLDNSTDGLIVSAGTVSLAAGTLDNRGGTVNASGEFSVTTQQALDNRGGTLASTSDLSLRAETLDNREGGLIVSVYGGLTAEARERMQNSGGSLQAGEEIRLVSTGLDNAGGSIIGGRVTVDARSGALDNSDGVLASIDGALAVGSGALNNTGGLLQSSGAMRLDTHGETLANIDSGGTGGILSGGTLDLSTGYFNNQQGLLFSQDDVTASTNRFDNSGGQFGGAANVTLDATALRNVGGLVQAGEDLTLSVEAVANNSGGLIVSAQGLSLSAEQIFNRDTGTIDQLLGLHAENITLNAQRIDNSDGSMSANGLLAIAGNDAGSELDNTRGSIVSVGSIEIDVGDVLNGSGLLLAGESLSIAADRLLGDGELLSRGDLSLDLQQDFSNEQDIIVNGRAYIRSAGDVSNSGSLQAGELEVRGRNVDNAQSGEISAIRTTVAASGTLTNRGLIDGGETRIEAGTLDNVGSGRIYGDYLSIQAGTLLNREEDGAAAVIAARGQLDIGVGTLVNRDQALIFSAGGLNIGGQLDAAGRATGTAGSIHNASATIESLGSMSLAAGSLLNSNEHFETEVVQVGETVPLTYLQPKDDLTIYSIDRFVWESWSRAGRYRWADAAEAGEVGKTPIPGVDEDYNCTGDIDSANEVCQKVPGSEYYPGDPAWAYFGITPPPPPPVEPLPTDFTDPAAYDSAHADWQLALSAWTAENQATRDVLDASIQVYNDAIIADKITAYTKYEVDHSEYETQVTLSAPALIRAGGNLTISGGSFINDRSQIIVGGALLGAIGSLENVDEIGEHRIHEEGTSQYSYSRWRGGFRRYHKRYTDPAIAYIPADIVEDKPLDVFVFLESTAGGGSGSAVGGRQTDQVGRDVESSQNGTQDSESQDINSVQADVAGVDHPGFAQQVDQVVGSDDPDTVVGESVVGRDGPDAAWRVLVAGSDAPAAAQGGPVDGSSSSGRPLNEHAGPSSQNNEAVDNTDGAGLAPVSSVQIDTRVPSNSLFRTGPNAGNYLVETDPRFSNRQSWLSSDYLLDALGADQDQTHKRLGDGFYEQKLVRDQIGQLTGRRYLDNYSSDDAQYRALLNAGATYAQAHNLRPGVALSAAQMAQLTSDIVWLVEQTVTLPDGTQTTVLAPQVYLRPRQGDLNGQGTLISASQIDLKIEGNAINTGTIAGRDLVQLNSQNLRNLGGTISGNAVALRAAQDIDNIGGTIAAGQVLQLQAGRDLDVTTTTLSDTKTAGLSDFSRTNINRVAGLYVSNPGGVLVAMAGRDVNLTAAQIVNNGGPTAIDAGGDINLNTITLAEQENNVRNANNYLRQGYTQEVGTVIAGTGSISLQAGGDLKARAATVSSTQGAVIAQAGNDLHLTSGEASSNWAEGRKHKHSSTLSSSTVTTRNSLEQTDVVGSSFSGQAVGLQAGNDLSLQGSSIDAVNQASISAGRDALITSAQSSANSSSYSHVKESGFTASEQGIGYGSSMQRGTRTEQVTTQVGSLVSGGTVDIQSGRDTQVNASTVVADSDININAARNVAVVAGTDTAHSEQDSASRSTSVSLVTVPANFGLDSATLFSDSRIKQNGSSRSTSAAASTIGSLGGDVNIRAGAGYTQTGSDLQAAQGDINVHAQTVNITEARETGTDTSQQTTRSITVGATPRNAVLDTVNSAQGTLSLGQATGQTANTRVQALGAAATGMSAYNTYGAAEQAIQDPTSVGIDINVGMSQSRSRSEQSSDSGRGSTLNAGGNISIQASGQGQDSDIQVRGSQISAGDIASLRADGDVLLEASQDHSQFESSNRSRGGSIGVGVQVGSSNGVTINASANQAYGNGSGQDTIQQNSQISAGTRVDLRSGGDTTLRGAVVSGPQVTAEVGGDLTIESLQDVSDFHNRQRSSGAGVSACVPPICYGSSSVSGSYSSENVDSHYASVAEQSGIRAGDGGFQIKVEGDTELIGGVITSSQTAIDADNNSFSSQTLSTRDIQNVASYQGESYNLNSSVGFNLGGANTATTDEQRAAAEQKPQNQTSAGVGEVSDSATSTTQAAISGIAGHQDARTGDAEAGFKPIFDADEVQQDLNAQVQITQTFGTQARTTVDAYVSNRRAELEENLDSAKSPNETAIIQAELDDLQTQERMLNILIGAVTGVGLESVTKESLSAASGWMRDQMIESSQRFPGVTDGITELSNISGVSEGVDGDGVKLGGTRIDLDQLCGPANERCRKNSDGSLDLNEAGQVVFTGGAAGMTLTQFLETDEGQALGGLTGGIQGTQGTWAGRAYDPGGAIDQLIEEFAGPHDMIGGQVSGLYDEQGNATRNRSDTTAFLQNRWSEGAIPLAAPFALANALPPEVWNAILVLVESQ